MAKITNTGVFIVEGSAAAADVAGSSQIWTKSDTPSSLYHTDDAGTDFRINGTTVSAEQATTSGTSIDFTGIPAGVKKITVCFTGVSMSGSANYLIQLGDAGGIETSGYLGLTGTSSTRVLSTAGLILFSGGASDFYLANSASFKWVGKGIITRSDSTDYGFGSTSKTLSQELTQVRITAVNGSDTFDAGVASIQFQ